MKKRKALPQPFWRFLFVAYCGVMLWLLFFRSYGWVEGLSYKQMLQQNYNLTPLLTIKNYWYVVTHSRDEAMVLHCIINLSGNIFLFIPAGWLLPRLWKKMHNFFRFMATCCFWIFLVETVQLFTLLGRFDIDDLILNLSGMFLGFVYFHIQNARKRKRK